MYQVIYQENNKIEILLSGQLSEDEFRQVIHQLELLCREHTAVAVLFEITRLKTVDFRVDLKDFELYKRYNMRIKKLPLSMEVKPRCS